MKHPWTICINKPLLSTTNIHTNQNKAKHNYKYISLAMLYMGVTHVCSVQHIKYVILYGEENQYHISKIV